MSTIFTDDGSRCVESITETINEAIARRVGPQRFRIWFKNSTRLLLTDGYVKVGVPNMFVARWLENHFADEIEAAARSVTGKNLKATFAIDASLVGHQKRVQLDSQETASSLPRESAVAQTRNGRRLKMDLDTFVVGPNNELAYNAAMAVVRQKQSPFNPLFIHGSYGLGKTHLLQGICNMTSSNRPGTNWLYLSAEDFANQFLLALKTRKLDAFRRRLRQTDLLAIDDIHFLASKPSTQEEFLHTFNTIDLAGRQVVLVSDAHPKMIGQLSEKLVDRFISGMVIKIDMPDMETRCRICRQYSETMGSHLIGSVIKYVAEHMKTNVRELQGAILKLTAYASLQNEKITLATAGRILEEHIARTDPIVHISDIESIVATFFGITTACLHSSKKNRTVALARHFSMYLVRKHTSMSSPEVGRFMGNKNHATVLLACKRIEEKIRQDATVRWEGSAGNKVSRASEVLSALEEGIRK